MWCYLVATTSLVIANALMYMNLYVDSITVPKFADDVVLPATAMVGGSILLIGSIIYVIGICLLDTHTEKKYIHK